MANENNPITGVTIFLFGIVVGGVAALLAGTDEDGNTREPVKEKIKTSKLRMMEGGQWAKEKSEAIVQYAEEAMAKAKKQMAAEVKMLQEKYGKIDKEKYAAAVKEVVDGFKKTGEVTVGQAKVMSKYMMEDYQLLAAASEKPAKKKSPTKSARKAK